MKQTEQILEGVNIRQALSESFEYSLDDVAAKLPNFEYDKGSSTEDGDTGSVIYFSNNSMKDRVHMSLDDTALRITVLMVRPKSYKKRTEIADFIDQEFKTAALKPKRKAADEKSELQVNWTQQITSEDALNKCIKVASAVATKYKD